MSTAKHAQAVLRFEWESTSLLTTVTCDDAKCELFEETQFLYRHFWATLRLIRAYELLGVRTPFKEYEYYVKWHDTVERNEASDST